MQAVPPVNASAKNAACIFYSYKGGFCKDIITSLYVFGDNKTLRNGERKTSTYQEYSHLVDLSDKCRPIFRDFVCREIFLPCDISLDKPQARKICRRTCEYLDQELCKKELDDIRRWAVLLEPLINCLLYDVANGGDAPECYQYYPLSGTYISVRHMFLNVVSVSFNSFK